MSVNKVNKNLFKALNEKCLKALDKITNGPLAFKSGAIIQYVSLNAKKDLDLQYNWYIDKQRIHLQDPSQYRFDWFIRQYLYASTQTTLFKFENIFNSQILDFEQYFDWNIDCLELIYRRANMNKYNITGEIEGSDKEIFIIGKHVTAQHILDNQFLKTPYTIKNICIKNVDQLKLTQKENDDFMKYLKQHQIKLIQFENKLGSQNVLEYIRYHREYSKIFVEDDILINELVNPNFPLEYKSDIILAGYQVKPVEQFNNERQQGQIGYKFPNISDLLVKDYAIQCAKKVKNEQFITLEKLKEQIPLSERLKSTLTDDQFIQQQIEMEAKRRKQKLEKEEEEKERQRYREYYNIENNKKN